VNHRQDLFNEKTADFFLVCDPANVRIWGAHFVRRDYLFVDKMLLVQESINRVVDRSCMGCEQ
jgi:hypothetical protein